MSDPFTIAAHPYERALVAGMKSFYFKLGEGLSVLQGWRAFILSGNTAFESAFHRRPSSRRDLWNGPIECELLGYPPVASRAAP